MIHSKVFGTLANISFHTVKQSNRLRQKNHLKYSSFNFINYLFSVNCFNYFVF